MMPGNKPTWLTFDCYGTLIRWDEGLVAAVEKILSKRGATIEAGALIRIYDKHEHELEARRPHRLFKDIAGAALARAMAELGLPSPPDDVQILTDSISAMPPFPEVVGALRDLKGQGFRLCIVSNTDDAIIAGNVAQLGGAYRPRRHRRAGGCL